MPKKWAFEMAGLLKEIFCSVYGRFSNYRAPGWEITNYSMLLKTRELSIGQTTVCTQKGTVNKGPSIKMQCNHGKPNNLRLNGKSLQTSTSDSVEVFFKCFGFTQHNPVQHLAAMACFCLDNSLPWTGMPPTQMRPSAVKSPSGKQCDKLNCKN